MPNTSAVTGDKNIVIQGISDSTITLNVGGETKEIANELAALKALLQEQQATQFTALNQAFILEEINEGNFGFVTGNQNFNESLTKQTIEALIPYSNFAKNFKLKVIDKGDGWEKKTNFSNVAKECISHAFVGILGIQIRKIMAIGKEALSEKKQRNYIKHCYILGLRIAQVLYYSLISELWNHRRVKDLKFNDSQSDSLTHFFDESFALDLSQYRGLLLSIFDIYGANGIEVPIEELVGKNITEKLKEDGDLGIAFQALNKIKEELDEGNFSLLTCYAAEVQLTKILTELAFLAAYKMVSIKSIGYQEMRNNKPEYLHSYASLGIDNEKRINTEKMDSMDRPAGTESILLFKGNFLESINLFPFIIDINALRQDGGSKICFYTHRNLQDDSLMYQFVEDESFEKIEHRDLSEGDRDLLDLHRDKKFWARKMYNNVHAQFLAAKAALLNSEESDGELSLADLA